MLAGAMLDNDALKDLLEKVVIPNAHREVVGVSPSAVALFAIITVGAVGELLILAGADLAISCLFDGRTCVLER
jgi:hypothetical protein